MKPKFYYRWNRMKQICGYYRGALEAARRTYAGVRICDEWLDYWNYHEWCVRNAVTKGDCIVRVDKDGCFSPENCVVVSLARSNGMRRCVRRLRDGRSIRDVIGHETAGRDSDFHNRVAKRVFERGWDVDSAIEAPYIDGKCRQSLSVSQRIRNRIAGQTRKETQQ